MKDTLFNYIEKMREEIVTLEKQLSNIPAIAPDSGGEGEWNKAQFLISWLNDHGITNIETFNAPDKKAKNGLRPNVIATIDGEQDHERLWIMSHLDVVPPGDRELWDTDPYTVIEKDGKLFGRGVEDNQQGIVASIFAALSLIHNKITPKKTVKLLFVADEELGSNYGIKYLLREHDIFKKGDRILVPDGGEKDGTMLEVAEKSILWLKFSIQGVQCHASRPEQGKNAFVAGSALVMKLTRLPEVFPQQNEIFIPPYSTFTPTKTEANIPNINTVPAEDVFYLDNRILPSVHVDEVIESIQTMCQEVEKKYGVTIKHETVQRVSSVPTATDAPIVNQLKKAVHDVYNVEANPVGIGGGTVASYLRNAGYDTVVWSRIAETAHMPNEYCVIDNIIGDAQVMLSLMLYSI